MTDENILNTIYPGWGSNLQPSAYKANTTVQELTYDFGKHLPRGQAWHNFNLPFCLSTCPVPGNQYNIYLYVVWVEMLKQTSLYIYCAIIKNVKIQKYIFWFSLWWYFNNKFWGFSWLFLSLSCSTLSRGLCTSQLQPWHALPHPRGRAGVAGKVCQVFTFASSPPCQGFVFRRK